MITPPDFDIKLFMEEGKIYAAVEFKNMVPIQYKLKINGLTRKNKGIIILGPNAFTPLYPTEIGQSRDIYYDKIDVYEPSSTPVEISLEFKYSSIYFYMKYNSKLAGMLVKKYYVDFVKQEIYNSPN